MLPAIPGSPEAISSAGWEELAPLYHALRDAPLDRASVREWLASWSALDDVVDEAYALAMVAYTADTRDAEREKAYLRWASDNAPRLHEVRVKLGERLLPFEADLPDLQLLVREIRTDVELFREANLPRMSELEEMEATYDKVTGGLTVDWDGERKTIPALGPYLLEQDRAVRERAFRAAASAYLEQHDTLGELFDRMVKVRHALAREAGFSNYRDYAFAAKYRFDYTPADCVRFHEAVEQCVIPAIARLHAARRQALGVDTLRPWDLAVHPGMTKRLEPFTSTPEFLGGAERIFTRVDPELGRLFRIMIDERLLDLESREGKAPGGYCTRLSQRRRAFIFMNAVGVHDDVNTLVHEFGHALHAFVTAGIPYTWQRSTGHEGAELASMSMELLAAPYIAKPVGYYDERDAAAAQLEHLEDVLIGLPHIACVDAFQHWLYTDGLEATPAGRDAKWLEIRARFEPNVDWSGLEQERISRWYRQSHIHTAPFYYIEYGIAQIGAMQVWSNAQRDAAGALARYREALALGGTASLPDIYATAGASLVFDAATMVPLVSAIEQRIAELRALAG